MEKKQSFEDYLERILMLEEKGLRVRSIDIANSMNFTRASVSIALKKLEAENLVTVSAKDFIIHLTEKGKEIASKTLHKHKTLTAFFVALGVSEETAAEDACKIEHDISDETFSKFEEYLNTRKNNK